MTVSTKNEWLIFTDGASRGNPGPGGWAAIFVDADDEVEELGGREEHTTNNRMELTATIRVLEKLQRRKGLVRIHTDSSYVIQGASEWIHSWMRRGWKTQSGEPVINQDLWERLYLLTQARIENGGLEWRHVPGHAGVPGNERADELAVGFATGKNPELYHGPLMEYFVALRDVPKVGAKPSKSKKTGKPYSYLSYVAGKAVRHPNWTACERRVKGQAGAKFKKAMTLEEEGMILSSWGVKPSEVKTEND